MLRASIFAATVLVAGCRSHGGAPLNPPSYDPTRRIQVAKSEAKRDAGVDELIRLATDVGTEASELAMRGLGRIGGAKARQTLVGALAQRYPPKEALYAIGLLASLYPDTQWDPGPTIVDTLTRFEREENDPGWLRAVRLAALEALGRAAYTNTAPAEPLIVGRLAGPDIEQAAACGLALGRSGRRKIPFSDTSRAALVKASTHAEARVRYAAVYALSREHEPPADQAVIAALASRIEDRDPEIRATAIAALVKRKAITAARKPIEDSLRDRDWRVAVEAVRALAGPSGDEAGRVAVASALPARAAALANGDPVEGQVVVEGLRTLLPNPVPLPPLAGDKSIAGGWIDCLTIAAGQPVANAELADRIARCQLPDHLRLPLLAELFDDKRSDAAYRRAALRMLLSHDDPRVRAAGIGAVIKTWGDGDDRAQATIIGTIASAIGAKNPIVAGTAIESAEALYEKMGASHPLQNTLDSAIVHRAATETDVELASALFGLIGKRAIAAGAESCRAGLTGHPVRAKAAAECLRALGEAVELPQPPAPPAPPVDVADVIVGYHPRWRLETTRGTILIELQPESAPWAVAAVMALTKQGFYDGLELHRVVPNFVVQGGDPTQSGWGGPGFTLPAEPASSADGPGFVAGGVGIADAGPDSGGSQWFIMHSRAPHLDGRYTWIGHVVLGQKWADALLIGDKVLKATIDQP